LIINARAMKEDVITVYSVKWHTDKIMYCVYYYYNTCTSIHQTVL